MINLIRAEWLKLRTTRVTFVLLVVAAAVPLLIVGLTAALASKPQEFADDLVGALTGTMVLTSMLLGVIAALGVTGEFSHKTIRVTFAAAPDRTRVMLAKLAVTVGFGLASAAVIALVTYFVGTTIVTGRDATFRLADHDRAALIGAIVLAVIVSVLGLGLGLIIRNSPTTVTVLILWPLLLESIIYGLLTVVGVDNPQPWLPYTSGISMASPDVHPDPSRLHGGLYFGGVALGLLLIGIFANNRRDA